MSKRNNSQIYFQALTERQKEVLTGCLLGDAYLGFGKGSLFPHLKIERKLTDLLYLQWQYDCFSNFCKSGVVKSSTFDIRTNKTYYNCRFLTRNIPEFLSIHQSWYPNGTKIVPRDIKLSPLITAIWFADDGYILHSGKSQLSLSLATDGFVHSDVLFLASCLEDIINESFKVNIKGISKNNALQYVIVGTSKTAYAFIKYIQPEFSKLSMDRKNVWKDISLDFPAQGKRSTKYYKLADLILKLNSFYVRDLVASNAYSKWNRISEALLNFFTLGYFTRVDHKGRYYYTITTLGRQYFSALQYEQSLLNKE
jgi:hypothetical protein